MELNDILSSLQYRGSPNFLQNKALESDRDFGHIFRKAQAECRLHGAYVLNGAAYEKSRGSVPVVYVCEADSETEAREIHRKVWNQNAVPFLLVVSRGWIRLYPGFQYEREPKQDALQGALEVLDDFNQIATRLSAIRAEAVDSGVVWSALGSVVTTEKRVDWKLLENLRELDDWLQQEGVNDRRLSHALIGKFVYFYYLRQRKILSDARLAKWEIDPANIFSHAAKLNTFVELVHHVDEWLNGSVFPLSATKIREFGAEKLRKVASVFQGEQAGSGQLPLFDIYDFSFIPIETLSVIYEQFLHATAHPSGKSEGETRGAYYTPVPLVNFMLDRLDSKKRLEPGMRVLDPSCGSGAFLVQCYRKLVERRRQELGRRLRPSELGHLLTNHVYGVDLDEDACQIAELSLALTLLDYVNPPDLTETQFKLPALRDRNIFHANAFDDDSAWYREARKRPFQWIVGNPPWKDLKPQKLDAGDEKAWQWMETYKRTRAVGGNQLAEAFAWRASEVLDTAGSAALLLPAMTLFKYESAGFRKAFLAHNRLWSVANFANLADVLFAGRATLPAAAFFYSAIDTADGATSSGPIEIYSPLIANQPASQTAGAKRRKEIWNVVVNSSDLREIEYRDVADGQALPWKIAMWGSPIDRKVLNGVERRYRTLGQLEEDDQLIVSQGMELRTKTSQGAEATERHDELAGKLTLNVDPLKNRRYIFRFPSESLDRILPSETAVRKGRFRVPMQVCEPPHVVVGASRNFAVYSEGFLVVPARQIGIASPDGNRAFLKAVALYLNSDFVAYHQFLTTSQAGIQKSINTLKALRGLPLPFGANADLKPWENLYSKIAQERAGSDDFNQPELVKALNELTFDSLKLSSRGRAAVHDLIHVRFGMTRGKTAASAVGPPSQREQDIYARMLRDELDSFVGPSSVTRHRIEVLSGGGSGLIVIDLVRDGKGQQPVRVWEASEPAAGRLAEARSNLMERRAQWLYFNRNLRVYEGPRTYILKPLQHLHWMRTQAIQDAMEIIADSLGSEPPESMETASL
jgi:hypothetical protein